LDKKMQKPQPTVWSRRIKIALLSLPPPEQPQSSPEKDKEEKNILFDTVMTLDKQFTTLHAALPPHTAFLLFLGHGNPHAMSALAARCAQFQASQNQSQNWKESAAAGSTAPHSQAAAI
jgi:hypothetical protein